MKRLRSNRGMTLTETLCAVCCLSERCWPLRAFRREALPRVGGGAGDRAALLPICGGLRVRSDKLVQYNSASGLFTVSFAIRNAQGEILKETTFEVKRSNAAQ